VLKLILIVSTIYLTDTAIGAFQTSMLSTDFVTTNHNQLMEQLLTQEQTQVQVQTPAQEQETILAQTQETTLVLIQETPLVQAQETPLVQAQEIPMVLIQLEELLLFAIKVFTSLESIVFQFRHIAQASITLVIFAAHAIKITLFTTTCVWIQ
jgi:hypothetical protein